jgi:dTDP-4-amino-4,6-dideoxygalactose transaminase
MNTVNVPAPADFCNWRSSNWAYEGLSDFMKNGDNALAHVPFAFPAGEAQALRAEIDAALARVVDGNAYILGPEVAAFETAMAASLDVRDVIGVASGTDALVLALLGLGVESGDEVITVSHTAGATVAALRMIGATPVLVDVCADTYCLAPDSLASALSPKTKAIVAVHLYGHPADIGAIREAAPGIPVVEDCAQAQGALLAGRPVGSLADLACFSFYPTKNLGALGDGGAVACNDEGLAARIRSLRTYGWTRPQYAELSHGRCSRLDEIQAALLSVKLKRLPGYIARRRSIAARYGAGLSTLPLTLPVEKPGAAHAFHLYVLRTDRRDELERHLSRQSVGVGRHYPFPVHCQPGLAAGARIPGRLAVTERISGQILSLPMFATMSDEQVDRVIAVVRDFFA